jgi:hypothetical protein
MINIKPSLSDTELDLIPSSAEAKFYRACRSLPSNWLVLFSVPWVGTTYSGRKYDGEADFVIFAPSYGMLIIEVKGGRVESDPVTGSWTSIDRSEKRHVIKNPYEQAKKEKYALLDILRNDSRFGTPQKRSFLSGHAVFFPDCNFIQVQSPGSRTEFTGTSEDLSRLEDWITDVFNYWGGENSNWNPLLSEMKTVEKILSAPLEARPLLSAVLKQEESKRLELTENQSRVLRAISNRKQAIVCGGAGTGKTLLALEQAQHLSSKGKKTLLVCYNRMLADYFNLFCDNDLNIDAMSFHQLCDWRARQVQEETGRDLIQEIREEFRGEDYFITQLPAALLYSGEILSQKYDAIVVDEGQDFLENYWEALTYLFKDEGNRILFVFLDPNQAIYGNEYDKIPITEEPFYLSINCRNTRFIHDAAYRFYKGETMDPPTGNQGAPIEKLISSTVRKQGLALYNSIVDKFSEGVTETQIAILVSESDKHQFYEEIEKYKLPRNIKWNIEGSVLDDGIKVDTVSRFKGLESDIVYLWGIEHLEFPHHDELLYVGISRAKSRLTLVGSKESCDLCLGD